MKEYSVRVRLGKAAASFFLWLAFCTGLLLVIPLQLLAIIFWTITGKPWLYDWVKRTGKGTDGVNNAAWFEGTAKETISSHAGRYLLRERETGAGAPTWVYVVDEITNLVEKDHCVKAIEEPFKNLPLD